MFWGKKKEGEKKVNENLVNPKDVDFIYRGIVEICEANRQESEPKSIVVQKIQEGLAKKEVILAYEGDEPAAFLWFSLTKKVPFGVNYGEKKERFCWINWAYSKRNLRKKGYGSSLFEELEKICMENGVRRILLDSFACNHDAQRFIEHLNYQPLVVIYQKRF